MDWLKNLYQQYLQSDIPAASLLRGDTSEFLPSVNRNLDQNLSLLSTPEGAMDLVNPMAKVGGLLGRTAYHGTPHIFDKFDVSKVGTGQGAQSFGHGIYFAENPTVAKEYQRQLSGWQPGTQSVINRSGGDLDNAINEVQRKIKHYQGLLKSGNVPKEKAQSLLDININQLNDLKSMKLGAPENKGYLYTVDIPDEQIPKMLNWDKSIGQQSPEVKKAIESTKKELTENNIADLGGDTSILYGDDVSVEQFLNTWSALKGADDAGEKLLNKYGVPGIKYLDQGSRPTSAGELIDVFKTPEGWKSKIRVVNRTGTDFLTPTDMFTTSMPFKTETQAKKWANEKISGGTSNYVVFDPTNIQILERK